MKRMNPEDRRNKSALPQFASHPPKYEEQQNHGGRVQNNIGRMMSSGRDAVQPAIQQVRKHRQRMPVGTDDVSKRPLYPLNRDAMGDIEISVNVAAIVEVDEPVSESLTKNEPNETGE